MSEEHKNEVPEISVADKEVRISGVKIPKKVAFEIDAEKTLRRVLLLCLVLAIGIYAYKGIKSLDLSSVFEASPKVAVLDLPGLKKEFFTATRNTDNSNNANTEFTKYFTKLMRYYRNAGYLVIDYSLTYSIPNTVKIVTYIDDEALNQGVTSIDASTHDEIEATH